MEGYKTNEKAYVPPIRKEDRSWARRDQDKAKMYARHLERVFQPNNIAFELDIVQSQPLNEIREKIKHFTPVEIAKKIDTNINLKKKAFRYDQISPKILKKTIQKGYNSSSTHLQCYPAYRIRS